MRKGQKLSEEAKKKISEKLKGRRCCMRTEFAKGHQTWNKGLAGKGICKANSGSFKKGNKPANYMGGMKICKDGFYKLVKKNNYQYKNKFGKIIIAHKYIRNARYVWEKEKGKIPNGMVLFHKDGDVYNDEIENLELISRAELLKRNYKPKEKDCIICGNRFLPKKPIQKTCSKKCNKENSKNLGRDYQRRYRKSMKQKYN